MSLLRAVCSSGWSSHGASGSQVRGLVKVTLRSRSGPEQSRPPAAAGLNIWPQPDLTAASMPGASTSRAISASSSSRVSTLPGSTSPMISVTRRRTARLTPW
nr:hypothetical protein [Jiangella rhizosphaerae]